jgi:hypothetical protein
MVAVIAQHRLRNSDPVLVSQANEAHRPVSGAVFCGLNRRYLVQITYIQAVVFRSPTWCPKCWRGGVS